MFTKPDEQPSKQAIFQIKPSLNSPILDFTAGKITSFPYPKIITEVHRHGDRLPHTINKNLLKLTETSHTSTNINMATPPRLAYRQMSLQTLVVTPRPRQRPQRSTIPSDNGERWGRVRRTFADVRGYYLTQRLAEGVYKIYSHIC